jgi:type I restriction enzyme M protein
LPPAAAPDPQRRGARQAEAVLQWLLRELLETYQYPQAWIGSRIIRLGEEGSASAVAVTLEDGSPFLVIAAAPRGKARLAEERLRTALAASATAGLGLASDGTEAGTLFLRRRFDSGKCEYINDLEVHVCPADGAAPFTDRLEDLFFELHSHLRDIDGLHADEALDELCKVLHAHLFDEAKADGARCGTAEELAARTRALYRGAGAASGAAFHSPIRLSSPALARVVADLGRFNLTRSGRDVRGRAFQKVLGPALRAGMGQYFTPEPVVAFMVETVRPRLSEQVLDPFCGSARFLTETLSLVRAAARPPSARALLAFASAKLHGIEKSDRMVRVAQTDLRLRGSASANLRCTDSLLDFRNYPDLGPEMFDVILTNPPFGCLLSAASLVQLADFELARGRRRVPLEVLGLERCLEFLRPGGRLAVVLPDSLLNNPGARYVREWLPARARLRAVVSLPIETFAPFGANIKTSILYLRKRLPGEARSTDHPVSLLRVDAVGYDAAGRDLGDSELPLAAAALAQQLDKEGW